MWSLGYEFATMFVTFACIICLKFVSFALQIYVNLNRDIFLVSREKKNDKVCIFSWNLDAWMFDILNENIGIHQFDCYYYALLTWGYARET